MSDRGGGPGILRSVYDRRPLVYEQHLHAERALRAEVEEQLALRGRDLAALRARIRELEHERGRMRRAVDEAEHLAAAARAAQLAAERELAEQRRRAERAYDGIELVRAELGRIRDAARDSVPAQPEQPPPEPPGANGQVHAERLSEALTRLRERTPAPPLPEPPAEPSRPALARAPAEPWASGVLRRRRLSPLRRWLQRARSG